MLIRKPGMMLFITAVVLLSCFVFPSDGLAVMSVDLGSQFMKVAIVKPGVPMEIVLNTESRRKTPVAVSLKDNERLFSDGALTMSVKYPKKSYVYVQDVLGKKFQNPLVQQYKQRFPWYDLEEDKETGTVLYRHDSETTFTPEEILGMILNHSRNIAEKFADHPMKDVVITVPSFFNQAERRSVIRAAKLVGLNVLQLMNENTAVALHYGVFRRASFNNTERFIMFYDMGATSTVATIVGYSTVKTKDRGITETAPQLVVKGVGFDRTLGGHAIDILMRDHLIKLFKGKYKTQSEVTQSPRAMAKFLKEAARVKQVLSANTEIFAQIEGVFEEKDFRAKVTREEFEQMCDDILKRVPGPVEQALKSSAIPLDEIENVILVGGGTRVPKVQELLLKAVKKSELGKNVNTDEAAALGAVYQAANLGKGFKVKKFLVKDANVYPIQVSFERINKAEDGSENVKHVKRMLYHRMNVVPQKKVMTFNRHTDDFQFHASYSELDFLNDEEKSMLGSLNLTTVSVKGVAAALDKHTPKGETKGIKAFFRMDENGILNLEKVESVFEKPEGKPEEEQSTFAKIGSKISSFFGGSKEDDKKESKVEEGDKSEEPESEKTDKEKTGEEEPKDKEEEKSDEKPAEKEEEEKKQQQEEGEKKEEEKKQEEEEKKEEEKKEEKAEEKDKEEEKKSAEKGKEKETKEDKKEESTEEKKDDNKKEEKASNKTEEAKKEKEEEKKPSKPVTVREPLEMVLQWVDVADTTEDALSTSTKKLKELQARDDAKAANERAKNVLETHIYNMRDRLFSDAGVLLSTEEERESMNQALSEASDWLDDEGWDSTADVYDDKLQKLKKQSLDLRARLREHKERPKAIGMLKNSLNLSRTFLVQINNITDKDEIYTAKDLEELGKIINDTTEWLDKNEKKQNETKPSENPVLLVKDIETKQAKLDRELVYLLNKAKYYVPKPKVNETASNTTKPKTDAKKEKQEKGGKTEGKNGDKQQDGKTKEEEKSKNGEKKEEKKEEKKKEEKLEKPDKPEKPEETKEKQEKDDKKDSDKEEPLPLPSAEFSTSEPADSSSSSADSSKEHEQSSDSSSKKPAKNDEL